MTFDEATNQVVEIANTLGKEAQELWSESKSKSNDLKLRRAAAEKSGEVITAIKKVAKEAGVSHEDLIAAAKSAF